MYCYGPPHMAEQKQDDQLEHTYSSYVRIQGVVLKTCRRRWTIGRSGERGSGISVLTARHDDDDDDAYEPSCFTFFLLLFLKRFLLLFFFLFVCLLICLLVCFSFSFFFNIAQPNTNNFYRSIWPLYVTLIGIYISDQIESGGNGIKAVLPTPHFKDI